MAIVSVNHRTKSRVCLPSPSLAVRATVRAHVKGSPLDSVVMCSSPRCAMFYTLKIYIYMYIYTGQQKQQAREEVQNNLTLLHPLSLSSSGELLVLAS